MTEDEVRKALDQDIARMGSTAAWARAAGVSVTWVDKVRGGKEKPSGAILRPLGLRRVVTYEKDAAPSAALPDPTSGVGAAGAPLPRGAGHGAAE